MSLPKVNFSEAIIEICRRTGLPENAVYRILWTYAEIVKESLSNQVCVGLADLGTFAYTHHEEQQRVKFYNVRTKEYEYNKIFPAYDSPVFNFSRPVTEKIKKDSISYYQKEAKKQGVD